MTGFLIGLTIYATIWLGLSIQTVLHFVDADVSRATKWVASIGATIILTAWPLVWAKSKANQAKEE